MPCPMVQKAAVANCNGKGNDHGLYKSDEDIAASITKKPYYHHSSEKNMPILIHSPRSKTKNSNCSQKQNIQQRLDVRGAVAPTASNDEAGFSLKKKNAVLIHTPRGEIPYHLKDDNGIIYENDKNSNINMNVMADAAALAAARKVEGEGKVGEEEHHQYQTQGASAFSPSSQLELMLNITRHVASSHNSNRVPMAPFSTRTAAMGRDRNDETQKKTKIEDNINDVADAGMFAADPTADTAIATKAPNENSVVTVDCGSSLLSGFGSVPSTKRCKKMAKKLKIGTNTLNHDRVLTTAKAHGIEMGDVSGDTAPSDFVYPQGGFIPFHYIHQQSHCQMVSNPAVMLPQYQQPFEADDNGGRSGYSYDPTPGGFVVQVMAQEPVACPPLPPNQQPLKSSYPGFLHPQQAIMVATAPNPWQQQHYPHLIMTTGPSLGASPYYVLPQASFAAHHQTPMMMPPCVFPQDYVQLRPLVQQQHQQLPNPPGFVSEQQHQPSDPSIFFDGVLHPSVGWVSVDMAGQPKPHPLLYQRMGMCSASLDVADAACVETSSATHAGANSPQKILREKQLVIQSPYSLPAKVPNSPPNPSHLQPSPIQWSSPAPEGNVEKTKNKTSILVHQPINSLETMTRDSGDS